MILFHFKCADVMHLTPMPQETLIFFHIHLIIFQHVCISAERDSEWQWHQLGRMQVCTSLQTDNHASTHHSGFYRPDALPVAQPTASNH